MNSSDHTTAAADSRQAPAGTAGDTTTQQLRQLDSICVNLQARLRLMNDPVVYRDLSASLQAVESAMAVLAAFAAKPSGAARPVERPSFSLARVTE